MAMFDLPLDELRSYTAPELTEPEDLDAFWATTLQTERARDLALTLAPYPTPWRLVDTYDVTFAGYGGTPVKAWLHLPAGAAGPLPTIVQYAGYSGGRQFPHSTLTWALAGYAALIMDTRGQGWSQGSSEPATTDADADAGVPQAPGLMTRGIGDPAVYYYRRVYVDAVRALDAARALDQVDSTKIIVTGASQGGGLTLAAASLAPSVGIDLVGAAPDVPFLSAFPRALQITDSEPYAEITRYLAGWRAEVETAYRTLSYFDVALLCQRAVTPALFSVGLMDQTCPPSTVFAAYNRYGAIARPGVAKDIKVYSHNRHEGGGPFQTVAQAEFFAQLLG